MISGPRSLRSSSEPLSTCYDCAMLDLDGVVYRGPEVVDGAPDLLRRAREGGMALAFVTNNAARTPEEVAAHLNRLGVEATATDVVTSAQAAAREVSKRVPAGAAVLVVGGDGLEVALRERGLVPVRRRSDAPHAVVQGFHPDVGWRQLAEASYVIASGVQWVASNLDLTVPTADGLAPGNGTLVNAVASAVGHGPDLVAGKPHRPLFDETMLRVGSRRPLMVGDRLDTDIEGANRCGADSLLVLTGVTDLADLCSARPPRRPSYVSWTLEGLVTAHRAAEESEGRHELDGWSVRTTGGAVEVERAGDSRDAGLRAVVSSAWAWYDAAPDGRERSLDTGDAQRALDAAPRS